MTRATAVCLLLLGAACGGSKTLPGDASAPRDDGGTNDAAITGDGSTSPADGSSPPDLTPAGPVLTASPGANKTHLSWTAVSGATSYDVHRSSAAGTQGTIVTTVTDVHFDDTTVTNFQPYFYTVVAEGADQTPSNQASAFGYALHDWTLRRSGAPLNSVAFAPGASSPTHHDLYVAVGDHGRVLDSADGVSWTNAPTLLAEQLTSVIFAEGMFVAVGEGIGTSTSSIFTSADGVTWTGRDSGTTSSLQAVALASSGSTLLPTNTFIAVGTDGTIVTSPDAVTWTSHTCGNADLATVSVTEHVTGSGVTASKKFMALAAGSKQLCYSTDGTTWGTIPIGGTTPGYVASAADDATSTIVALDYNGLLAVVPYDFTGNKLGTPAFPTMIAPATSTNYTRLVSFIDGASQTHMVALRSDGKLFDSLNDGTSFTTLASTLTSPLQVSALTAIGLGVANTTLFVLGYSEQILRSADDGATLVVVHDDPGGLNSGVGVQGGVTVVDHADGSVLRSTDGISFASVATGVTDTLDLELVTSSAGFAVFYVDDARTTLTVASSTDGQAWTTAPVATPLCNGCLLSGGPIIASGSGYFGALDEVLGATYTELTLAGTSATSLTATLGNVTTLGFWQMWIAGGTYYGLSGTAIYSSPDGVTWTQISTLPSDAVWTTYLDAGATKYIASLGGGVSTSTDGVTWSTPKVLESTGRGIRKIVRIGDDLVVVGDYGLLYTSSDGVNWAGIQTAATGTLYDAAVTDRGLVVVGSLDNVLTVP